MTTVKQKLYNEPLRVLHSVRFKEYEIRHFSQNAGAVVLRPLHISATSMITNVHSKLNHSIVEGERAQRSNAEVHPLPHQHIWQSTPHPAKFRKGI
jgi:hypothetical protein